MEYGVRNNTKRMQNFISMVVPSRPFKRNMHGPFFCIFTIVFIIGIYKSKDVNNSKNSNKNN